MKEKVVNVPCINSSAVKMDIDTELRETANLKCDMCENGHGPVPFPADVSNPDEQRYYHPCRVDMALVSDQKAEMLISSRNMLVVWRKCNAVRLFLLHRCEEKKQANDSN